MSVYFLLAVPVLALTALIADVHTVRPTRRGLVERLGRYNRWARPGSKSVVPLIEKLHFVNITEQMIDGAPQEIITFDNLKPQTELANYENGT